MKAVLLLALLGAASCRVLLQKEVPDAYPDEHPVNGDWQDTCVLKDAAGNVKSTTYGSCFDCHKAGMAIGAYKMEWHGGSWTDFAKYNWLDVCNVVLVDEVPVATEPVKKGNKVPDAYPDEHPVNGNWQDTCVLKDAAGNVKSTTYGSCFDCHKAGMAAGAYTMEWHGGYWSDFAKYNWLDVCNVVLVDELPAATVPTVPAKPANNAPAKPANVVPEEYPDEQPVVGNWQDTCVLKDAAGNVKSTTYGTCYDCHKAGMATGAYTMEWHGGYWSNFASSAWDVVCGDWENQAKRG